ncbi:MAG: LptF/LptG family permease [Elusimicrobia bacterium]|nr:LptF/LptG family permease [Elusimicrobiota bacterium]
MKLIYVYLIKEFLKPLFFSSAVFGILVVISEFFRNLTFYLEQKSSFFEVFKFLFLNLPWWSIQVLPVSVFLAVLFSLGEFARHGEITALKAAGINLWRIISMFLFCGLIIGLLDLSLREIVIPHTSRAADKILIEKIHRERPRSRTEFYDLVVSLPRNGRMTIGYLNTKDDYIKKGVIDFFDPQFNLIKQIVFESAYYKNRQWYFSNGVERIFKEGGFNENYFQEKILVLYVKPEDFVLDDIRPEQKTTRYYKNYIRQLETLGIPSENERIQFNLRFSSIFSYLIAMLIGIPFAVSVSKRFGKILSFIFALIFGFIYWAFQAVGQSMGQNKVISPFIAAWLSNIIFGLVGFYLLSKVRK